MAWRKTAAEVLEAHGDHEAVGRWFNVAMLVLIAANIAALMLETVESLGDAAHAGFAWFERVSIAVFTAEYLARVWSCVELDRMPGGWRGRLRFATTPMMLIDLIAIAPFYLPALGLDLRSARALRLLRLFRVAKMGRYSRTLQAFGRVVRSKSTELLTLLFLLVIMIVIASSAMYFAEHQAQPDAFSSIPQTAWWAVTTLTTVGYGDVRPVTDAGRILASVIAVLGIGVFALPTGVLGAAFVDELRGHPATGRCPHCGGSLDGTAPVDQPAAAGDHGPRGRAG